METQVTKADARTSRVGKRPLALPTGVAATISGGDVQIKGPKGTLSYTLPANVTVALDDGALRVTCSAPGRHAPRLQGLARALLANMLVGVTEGYKRTLELHGTGYRAEAKGQTLHFALGLSHQVEFVLPNGVSATIPGDAKGSLLILEGIDKAVVGQTAATIRGFRPPEPYSGKGVRYRGERVREKAGKAGKK